MLEALGTTPRGPAPAALRLRLVLATLLALLTGLLLATPAGAGVTGSVTINKFDAQTLEPLADACFVLLEEAPPQNQVGEEQCTDATGAATFPEVPLGDYLLFETVPAPGYFSPGPTPVSVTAEEPNPVVDVPNFPPTATLQVHKFDCTGAESSSLHVFVNPIGDEIPSGLGLDECAIGHATFLVAGGDLPEAQALETNLFGFALTELDPGTYQLYETSPNQAGPVSFTVSEFDFAVAAAINPLELPAGPAGPPGPQGPPGPPGPAGQPAPAVTTRPVGRLPDTAAAAPVPLLPAAVWLAAVATASGISIISLRRTRRP